jgi:hypothetical protein
MISVTPPVTMRVLTIFVRHGVDQYAGAEEIVDAILERQLPGLERDVIVVDNALPPETVQSCGARTLLGADNRQREFSAFDRAVGSVGPSIAGYDFVHFVTSAFNTLYTRYLERFTLPVLRSAAGRAACLGHIDCYNEPVRLGPFVSQHWMRSCFFFLRPDVVRALGSFVSVPDGSAYFSGDPAAPFRSDAPVSDVYRRYIIEWLTGGDIGQGVTWHSKIPLTRDTLPSFESKTLAIFNEHLLSVRLRALGCRVVDVTWLSSLVGRTGLETVPWESNWRQQLADRDRDSITGIR